jgi:Mg2+ and Co2+ transporter CorA
MAYGNERIAELLYSDAGNSLEFVIAQQTEEQAQASHQMAVSSHRLTVLAAFFFPLATLSGLFGVNMYHGFESDRYPSVVPFLVMLAVGLISGFLIKSLIFNKGPGRYGPEGGD